MNWITSLFSKGYRALSDLATDVRNAVGTFWDDVTGLASDARQAESWMLNSVQAWASKEASTLGAMYTAVRRAIEVRVPALISQAVNGITGWVGQLVTDVRHEAAIAVSDLRSWATSAVNAVTAWVDRVIAWADQRLSSLESWLTSHGLWITQLLSDPAILADWLLLAMFRAMFRYVTANAEPIARYAVRNAVPVASRVASDIEQHIADIL